MSALHRGLRKVRARCCATAGTSPGNGAGMLYLGNLSAASGLQRGFHGRVCWVAVLGYMGVWVPWNRRGKGCRMLKSTETARVAAGRSQDKARDLIRERYRAYTSAGADYDSKWNPGVGNNFWGSGEGTRYVPENLSTAGPMLHRTSIHPKGELPAHQLRVIPPNNSLPDDAYMGDKKASLTRCRDVRHPPLSAAAAHGNADANAPSE
ncbi:hypothetical protein VE02_04687 [Pseudogymnoascus sp. 03VT05]|nr:hypothetical protein VE02_04687 [Pseudogymnoascus sp. 03VT05]